MIIIFNTIVINFFLFLNFIDPLLLKSSPVVDDHLNYYSNQIRYTASQRGRPILWYLGHRFRKERHANNNREYWRCLMAKCTGRCILYQQQIVKYHRHNHDPVPYVRRNRCHQIEPEFM